MEAGNQESIQSQKNPRLRNPLNVVVEKVGATRAMVHGDVSVESLKELLMSSLSLLPSTRMPNDFESGSEKSGSPDPRTELKKGEERSAVPYSKYNENKAELKITSGSVDDKEQKLMAEINGEVRATGKEIPAELSAPKKIDDKVKSKRDIRDQTGSRLFGTKTGRKPKSGGVDDDDDEEDEEGDAEDGIKSLSSCLSVFSTEESPFSNDGRWLQRHFEKPLVKGLRDLANKKPQDPVGYLAFWLRKYRCEEEVRRRKRDFDNELLANRSLATAGRAKEQEDSAEIVEPEYCSEDEEAGGSADWNFKNYNPTSEAAAIQL